MNVIQISNWDVSLRNSSINFAISKFQAILVVELHPSHSQSSLDQVRYMNSTADWYEQRDINHTIYFNEDVKKRLSKLSKDVSTHATLKKNEVWLL